MKYTSSYLLEKFNTTHSYKYTYPTLKDFYNNLLEKITIQCPFHGIYSCTIANHFKHGCAKCAIEAGRMGKEEFIKKANYIHNNKYNYDKVKYINSNMKVIINCPEHGDFLQCPSSHLIARQGCPKCGKNNSALSRTISIEDYITRIKTIYPDLNYEFSLIKNKFINKKKKVPIICHKHGVFYISLAKLLYGRRCSKCSGKYKKTTEEFITIAKRLYGDKYDLSKVKYVNKKTKVIVGCKEHGYIKIAPEQFLSGTGCKYCNFTAGEQKVLYVLDKYKLKYLTQYKINKYRYDFYLPKLNIFIEFDGKQHFIPVKYFGGEKGLELIQSRDFQKNIIVNNLNGVLIRISYLEINQTEEIIIKTICNIYPYYYKKIWFNNYKKLCSKLNITKKLTHKELCEFKSINYFLNIDNCCPVR